MAGLSSRFTRAGYTVPKYRLPLKGHTVFDYSVGSFRSAFETTPFLFIAMNQPGVEDFVSGRLASLGVREYRLVLLQETTRGQAETVMLGLNQAGIADDEPVTVFNIDTFCLGSFAPLETRFPEAAGVLQVFRGTGDNWSFVEADPDCPGLVKRTTEKIPISNLCCTGLYHFARAELYRSAYSKELKTPQSQELYIAPMYNHLIAKGAVIAYDEISPEKVIFCGVPAEYEALLKPHSPIDEWQP